MDLVLIGDPLALLINFIFEKKGLVQRLRKIYEKGKREKGRWRWILQLFSKISFLTVFLEKIIFFPILSLYGDIQRNKYNKTCDLQLDF